MNPSLRSVLLFLSLLWTLAPRAQWQAPTLATHTGLPPTNTELYFYLPDKEMFLTQGTTWGTHTALTSSPGAALVYTIENYGTYYRLHAAQAASKGYLFLSNKAGDPYVDYNGQDITYSYWQLAEQSDGRFRILLATANNWYAQLPDYALGWNPNNIDKDNGGNSLGTNIGLFALPDNGNNLLDWTYVTASDLTLYDARLQLYNLLLEAQQYGVDTSEAALTYNSDGSTLAELRQAYADLQAQIEANEEDCTEFIKNPRFEGNISGWTVNMPGAQNKGYQSASYTNGDISISQFAEAWIPSGRTLGEGSIYQTVTGLPAGTYTLEADVIACNQQTGALATGVYLFAADTQLAVSGASGKPQHFALTFTTDGSAFTLGLSTLSSTTANWVAFDNLRLIYHGRFDGNPAELLINEIQVANIDQYMDLACHYGAWVELYNPTSSPVSIGRLFVSDDAGNLCKHQLPWDQGFIPAGGFKNLWFDHYDTGTRQYSDLAYKQVPFKLNYEGGAIYISDSEGNLIASQTYPAAIPRTSYARMYSDGNGDWGLTGYPTPEASNRNSSFAGYRLPAPVVSHESTVFTEPFTFSVEIPAGFTLFYTTDGSTPTDQGGAQISSDGRFTLSAENRVYRFRFYRDNYLPSAVVTRTFIYKDKDYYLPIVSIVTNPQNLYDEKIGAYVVGTNGVSGNGVGYATNKNRSWERPVNFDYLVPNENQDGYSMALSQEVDFEVAGGWTRNLYAPESSFRLTAKKQYEGENYLGYSFFDQKPYIRSKAIQIRNGGNDGYARIKDAALHQIVQRSGFYVDLQSWQPAHIFINGKYQYMFNIREPSNKNNGYANYGMDTDEMDQFEINGTNGYEQKAGTDEAFRRWMSLAEQLAASPTDETIYQEICNLVDIDEYCNYMALECYLGSSDWLTNCNNTKGYRSRTGGGKFHLVMFDLDAAFGTRQMINKLEEKLYDSRYDTGKSFLIDIFLNMLKHEGFRRQFIDAFCLVGGSVFEPTRSTEIITEMATLTEKAMSFNNETPWNSANSWISNLTDTSARTARITFMRDHFGLTETYDVKLSSNIPDAQLQVNGQHVPTGRFEGLLLAPITVKAQAPAGYRFVGWTNGDGEVASQDSVYALSGDCQLEATFERLADEALVPAIAMPIKVNEVSAANSVYVNEFFKRNDWFELYNTTDTVLDVAGLYVSNDVDNPTMYQIPVGSVLNTHVPAHGHIVVWADKLTPTTQLHTTFNLNNSDGQMVLVTSSEDFVAANASFFDEHPALQSFADGLKYASMAGDQSVGRYPDGGLAFYQMTHPTVGGANWLLTSDKSLGTDHGIMDLHQKGFALDLYEGWNWVSHPLAEAIPVSTFKSEADRILSQTLEAYYSPQSGTMAGLLKRLSPATLYKIAMNRYHSYQFDGIVPSVLPATVLRAGWNWIGYPETRQQSLTEALAGSHLEEGDLIMGQNGFSYYTTADGWVGDLSTLTPGNGYMYRSASAKSIRFNKAAPSAVRLRRMAVRDAQSQRFGYDRHAYPNVMGIIAEVELNGERLDADALTLVAYADGECRGASKSVAGRLFLTLYGQGGESLTFRAIDDAGQEYSVSETLSFSSDLLGTPLKPQVFHLSGDETSLPAASPSPLAVPVGYYTLSGTLAGNTPDRLRPGIYIVRYSDGSVKKKLIRYGRP